MKKSWNKTIWIASKNENSELDDYGNPVEEYGKPEEYKMNVQPVSSEADIQEFGENAKQMQKAVIEYSKYFGKFKEFDVAYLDGITPENENKHGQNANYRLHPPRNQNKCIVIYFERLTSK